MQVTSKGSRARSIKQSVWKIEVKLVIKLKHALARFIKIRMFMHAINESVNEIWFRWARVAPGTPPEVSDALE